MAKLKASKTIKYKVGKNEREATHTVALEYEVTKPSGTDYVIVDLRKLTMSQSYKGNGAGTDDAFRGSVKLTLGGSTFLSAQDAFRKGGHNAINVFRSQRDNAVQKRKAGGEAYVFYGSRYTRKTITFSKTLKLTVGVYNPATKKTSTGSATVSVTIDGTGVVKVTMAPDAKVTGLVTPVRGSDGSRVMTSTFGVTDKSVSTTNKARFTGIRAKWSLGLKSKKSGKASTKERTLTLKTTDKSTSVNIASFTDKDKKTYTRASFYPLTDSLLTSVSVGVCGYNAKGDGPVSSVTRAFTAPKAPTVSDIEQDKDTGIITCTITSDPGNDYAERYRTRYKFTVYDSSKAKGKELVRSEDSSIVGATLTKTLTHDVSNRMQLTTTQYVLVTVEAWNEGFAGDSSHVKKTLYVSWPATPTITQPKIPSRDVQAKVTVPVNTNYVAGKTNAQHPVTGVRLEALVNVDYAKASEIPGDAGWQQTSAQDNGSCTALSCMVGEINPEKGKRTWLRVKAWNQFEDVFYLYSTPIRVDALYVAEPTAADDVVTIVSATPQDDGRSVLLLLGWDRDDSTGTEVSWSDDEHAWQSTEEPKAHQFTWAEEKHSQKLPDGVTYYNVARLYVRGLTEGTRYFFRARRYMEKDSGTEFGPYYPADGEFVDATPVTSPDSVVLSAPAFVERGTVPTLTWTYDSEATQVVWELVTGTTMTTTDEDERTHTWIDQSKAVTVVASGTDASGSCVPDADRFAALTAGTSSIPLAVRMGTGGDLVMSEAMHVGIEDAPSLSATVGTLTAQPLLVALLCDTDCDVAVTVVADGMTGDGPSGTIRQANGDTVWTALLTPEWVEDDEGLLGHTATVPVTDQLHDGARYRVVARAYDRRTGLASDEVSAPFEVAYARKAPKPSLLSHVEAQDEYDEEGRRKRSAIITLVAPEGAEPTDRCDVYRVTQDGPSLLMDGVDADAIIYDEWAPFGDFSLAYRVALRTADGCVAWEDIPYVFGEEGVFSNLVRVDYEGGYVELSRGVSNDDAYSKDFRATTHLDGQTEGYWNEGYARTGSISGQIVRIYESDAMAMLRALGRQAGPAFVRTSDGVAYEANVEVPGIGTGGDTAGVSVSLRSTEVRATRYLGTLYEEPEDEDEGYESPDEQAGEDEDEDDSGSEGE